MMALQTGRQGGQKRKRVAAGGGAVVRATRGDARGAAAVGIAIGRGGLVVLVLVVGLLV